MMLIMAYLAASLFAAAGEVPGATIAEVCAADHARLCSENSIQSDGAMRCLMDRRQDVSEPCRGALNARRQWVQERVRSACTNEIAAFCLQQTSLYFTAIANGNSQMYHSSDLLRCLAESGLQVVVREGDITLDLSDGK